MPDAMKLTIASDNYPFVQPLREGAVKIPGCNAEFVTLKPGEMTKRAFDDPQFDVAELSIAQYITLRIKNACRFTILPVYVHRTFAQRMFYVPANGSIQKPQDLRGKRLGISGYDSSANTWLRGVMKDEYSLEATDVLWVQLKPAHPRPPFTPPNGVRLETKAGASLDDLLERGEIDAIASSRAPTSTAIKPLFPDVEATISEYFKRSGIYPIMHVIGIRTELAQSHPDLPGKVYRALLEAKNQTLAANKEPGWATRIRSIMADPLPYGIKEPNRKSLEAFARYHHEQGASPRRYEFSEMFAPVDVAQYA
jgi:4,5-dihydroxyphthalate decarboxylase